MVSSLDHHLAVVFDFGGVLFDWSPRYLYQSHFNGDMEAVDRFLDEVGFYAWNDEQDRGRSFGEAIAVLTARFPQYTRLIRAYDEEYIKSIGGAIQTSVDRLWSLKQAGYPLYALSNWSVEKFRVIRSKYAFLDWFDDILISGEVKLIKPDPLIFEAFLARTHRRAEECLFIDDSAKNAAAARGLGFKAIHYQGPEQLDKELRRQGVTF